MWRRGLLRMELHVHLCSLTAVVILHAHDFFSAHVDQEAKAKSKISSLCNFHTTVSPERTLVIPNGLTCDWSRVKEQPITNIVSSQHACNFVLIFVIGRWKTFWPITGESILDDESPFRNYSSVNVTWTCARHVNHLWRLCPNDLKFLVYCHMTKI